MKWYFMNEETKIGCMTELNIMGVEYAAEGRCLDIDDGFIGGGEVWQLLDSYGAQTTPFD